jgi:DNA-binding NtrC family response regulator
MEYLLRCDNNSDIRIVAAADRRDWKRRSLHPLEAEIRTAARSHVPVLISAGKARAKAIAGQIHRRSGRPDSELMVVDCSLPPQRYEEQVFETNANGTHSLLLLEVANLPMVMQVRLRARLTVEARARTIGASPSILGGRIMATSSRSLFDAVEAGSFDRDLFYRLNMIHIVTT